MTYNKMHIRCDQMHFRCDEMKSDACKMNSDAISPIPPYLRVTRYRVRESDVFFSYDTSPDAGTREAGDVRCLASDFPLIVHLIMNLVMHLIMHLIMHLVLH